MRGDGVRRTGLRSFGASAARLQDRDDHRHDGTTQPSHLELPTLQPELRNEAQVHESKPLMIAPRAEMTFPVVCVGGSAGGLDAYSRLLRHLPADMGVAIVIVSHQRTIAAQLHKILPYYTKMPVELITEGLDIRPNHVFIIPPRRDLHVLDGEFRLKPISKPRGWSDVITVFLRSLTQYWDGQLIAVIVSGYDGDGSAALRGIKDVGGITIAQKPETAAQPDMPDSAIASGYIDFILSPEEIAQKILRISRGDPEHPQPKVPG